MKSHGYTLVEVLVVTGIIGTLAMIAVPQYQSYKDRASAASVTFANTGERVAEAEARSNVSGTTSEAATASTGSQTASNPSTNGTVTDTAGTTAQTSGSPATASTSDQANTNNSTNSTAGQPPKANTATDGGTQQTAQDQASSSSTTASSGGQATTTSGAKDAIQVADEYKKCTSEDTTCKVKAGDDFEVSFDVKGLGKVSEKDFKLVTTGGAKVDDYSFNSKKGTLEIDIEAPDNKNKIFSLTVNVDKEKRTLYFKTS